MNRSVFQCRFNVHLHLPARSGLNYHHIDLCHSFKNHTAFFSILMARLLNFEILRTKVRRILIVSNSGM